MSLTQVCLTASTTQRHRDNIHIITLSYSVSDFKLKQSFIVVSVALANDSLMCYATH